MRLDAENRLNAHQKKWMSYQRPPEELYDVKADPFQLNNLTENPEYAEILEEMRAQHEKWTIETGDLGHMNESELICLLYTSVFGEVKPVLLHGDLWGGNYLIANDGTPYLIDPATYYGHSMVDIAMSHLFGGFSPSFYDAYHEIIPKPDNYVQQIELYPVSYTHLDVYKRQG